jgi:hypothetical protein
MKVALTNYVVCLKWGTKYSAEYVNKLHSMVKRNLTLPYEFVCFTENTQGINKQIRCEPLPNLPLQGWWYKLWFLSNDFPLDGTILFLDLDLIIFNNIDKLFMFKPDNFCSIRDFNRSLNIRWERINSSVFKFQSKKYKHVFDNFINDSQTHIRKFHGDQDFMFKHINDNVFWPDEWIQSYKWEMRSRTELTKIDGKRNFKTIGTPVIKHDTKIAVFHGEPNPQDCKDPWVIQHWC